MKIFVVPRHYVEKQFDKDPDWIHGKSTTSSARLEASTGITTGKFRSETRYHYNSI